jgi:hypothetical protein
MEERNGGGVGQGYATAMGEFGSAHILFIVYEDCREK